MIGLLNFNEPLDVSNFHATQSTFQQYNIQINILPKSAKISYFYDIFNLIKSTEVTFSVQLYK